MVSNIARQQSQFNINHFFAKIVCSNFIFRWVRTNLFAHLYCYCFYTVKWFQLLLSNTYNSYSILIIHLQALKWLLELLFKTNYPIEHYSFIYIRSNGSKYCDFIPIFQFRYTVKEFQVLLLTWIIHYSLVCTQLKNSKYYYVSLTIQLNMSHLFIHS